MTAVDASATTVPETDPDDQAAWSPRTRSLLTGLVALIIGSLLLAHVPTPVGGEAIRPIGESVMHAMGIEMNWTVFSPNPPDRTLLLEARITFEDGSTAVWRPPEQDPWLGTYHQYRWDKLAEFTVRYRSEWAAPQLAESLAHRYADTERGPVERVVLVAREKPIEAIGGDWTEEIIATFEPGDAT